MEGDESPQNDKAAVPALSRCWSGDILIVLLLGETNLTRKLKIYSPKINRLGKLLWG